MYSLPACPSEIGIFGNGGFREGGEPENKLNSWMNSGSKNRTCTIFIELTGNYALAYWPNNQLSIKLFSLKSAYYKRKFQENAKLQFLTNCKEVVAPHKSTSNEVSFKWSHPRIPSQIQRWSSKITCLGSTTVATFICSLEGYLVTSPLNCKQAIHRCRLHVFIFSPWSRETNLFCFVLLSEFSSRNPVLFARFIPNLLPPTQCEQLPSIIQEDRMLQEDLVTSQGFSR